MTPPMARAITEVLYQADKAGPSLARNHPSLAQALAQLKAQAKAATR